MLTLTQMREEELFETLSRNRDFRVWLEQELAKQNKVLATAAEIDHLRKAQGKAQLLMNLIERVSRDR